MTFCKEGEWLYNEPAHWFFYPHIFLYESAPEDILRSAHFEFFKSEKLGKFFKTGKVDAVNRGNFGKNFKGEKIKIGVL